LAEVSAVVNEGTPPTEESQKFKAARWREWCFNWVFI